MFDLIEITKRHLINNRTYKKITPQFGVVHETANEQGAGVDAHFKYCNTPGVAFAHVYIDDKKIDIFCPLTELAKHVGNANKISFGVELCRPKGHDPDYFSKLWKNGVFAFANFFIALGWTTVSKKNLKSHDECRKEFGGTTHTDPVEFFEEYGKTVDDFRTDVQNKIMEMMNVNTKNIETFDDAINYLTTTKIEETDTEAIINSGDFWRMANATTRNIDALIIDYAKTVQRLKGK